MTDLKTKPRSGLLLGYPAYTELMDRCLELAQHSYESTAQFSETRGIILANHERAGVALMRIAYAPYYDTRFILKYFKTENMSQAPIEQVELEAASLRHAANAFRRNNCITRAPRVYSVRAESNLVTMECIHGRDIRGSRPEWWPKERMVKYVRQMAVLRIALLTQVENHLGVPRHAPQGGRVGPYCANVWWDDGRHRFWDQIDRGPFPNRHEMILACLRRDLVVVRWMRDNSQPLHRRAHFKTIEDVISYLESTIENIDQVPRPTRPEFFSLSHNDLLRGFNFMLRGSKIAGIIDWETGSYEPLSRCVSDLTNDTDYNPRVWREHAGPNGEYFHLLPYRLEADPINALLAHYTAEGAERKPYPDWELIENHGGALSEEDFCGDYYAEDISSGDDESTADAEEIHCDSDADAGEACVMPDGGGVDDLDERRRRGKEAPPLNRIWYYEAVYALMKEFIQHQAGAGLGPDGEWGRLPEEYSQPLVEWDDPLFWRITQNRFDGRRGQIINPQRVPVAASKAAKSQGDRAFKIKKQNTPQRQRRVPALLNSPHTTTAPGSGVAPGSPVSSCWSAYMPSNIPPRRVRQSSPPMLPRAGSHRDGIPHSELTRAPALTQAKEGTQCDPPPWSTLPSDDGRVQAVRDAMTARVMDKWRARKDGITDVL